MRLAVLPPMLVLAACGSPAPAATPVPPVPRVISLTDADNHRTLHASVGDRLTVTLHSTYWQIGGSANATVVAALGPPTFAPVLTGCVPGQGCGTVSERFAVRADGSTALSANRTVCGEALRCTPDQQLYSVTILVP